jgi:hypothetical protein
MTPASAQRQGGGGGGGRGDPQDPTAHYIKQLKLEGTSKSAFQKAFRNHTKRVEKWRSNIQKFQKKNQKYVGKPNPAPEVLAKIKAEKAELDAQQVANTAAYKEDLAIFLTPTQVERVDAIDIQISEQRKKAQERRAANQAKQGQGGGKKK